MKTNMNRRKSGQGGFTLIELLITLGITSAGTVAVLTLIDRGVVLPGRTQVERAEDIKALNLMTILTNSLAWRTTSEANTNLGVFRCTVPEKGKPKPENSCPTSFEQGAEKTFAVFGPDGQVFYDPRRTDAGFTADGVPCTGYSRTQVNPNCPSRIELSWRAICENCSPLQIEVRMQMVGSKIRGPAAVGDTFHVVRNLLTTECPAGEAPHPDNPSVCGLVRIVYSGLQRYGSCGHNYANLDRCVSSTPAWYQSSASSCYHNIVEFGTCISGYNCPSDAAWSALRTRCGNSAGRSATEFARLHGWDSKAPGARCIPLNSTAATSTSCLP